MELWYTEKHTKNVKFSMKVDEVLITKQGDFQRIDVLKTKEFGRVLVLDGLLMLTEKDEFMYHEMIVHVPMAVHEEAKNILVIGAGDGGTIRELTAYDTIERIDVVEIDKAVVEICKEYLPQTASKLTDERVKIFYEDGLKYVRTRYNEYDLIIVDSTDPFGPGEGLFTKEFYGNCFKALKEDGILINQHESPYYDDDAKAMQKAHKQISSVFPISTVYQFHMPTYPSGHWLFGFASKSYDPLTDLKPERWEARNIKTRYYNTLVHQGAFYLPNYVKKMLRM